MKNVNIMLNQVNILILKKLIVLVELHIVLKESHRPCTCELIDKFICLNRNTSLDDYDKRRIEANTKECPHRHQKIQKN